MHLLAQYDVDYFMNDPTGQKIAAGVGVAIALIIVIAILRAVLKNKELMRKLVGAAIVLGLAVWIVGSVTSADLLTVLAVAGVLFGLLVVVGVLVWSR